MIVVMMPLLAVQARMRLFQVSLMTALPALSTATLNGALSWALVPGPPSPLAPPIPVPAIVRTKPSEGVNARMRCAAESAIITIEPLGATPKPNGLHRPTLVPGPPPLKLHMCAPLAKPTTVEKTLLPEFHLRTRWLYCSTMYVLLYESAAIPRGFQSKAPGPEAFRNPISVEMLPVALSHNRMILLLESAIKTLPAASSVIPDGLLRSVVVPGPSPLKPGEPVPAISVMAPGGGGDRLGDGEPELVPLKLPVELVEGMLT